MEVSETIIEKILNDNNFSIELAKRLGNQQQSVLGLAIKNKALQKKRFLKIISYIIHQ